MMETIEMTAHAARTSGWSEPPVLVLDESGMIRDCSIACEELFGYSLRELSTQHVSGLLPELKGIELVHDGRLNAPLEYLCHCGHVFWAHNRQGGFFPSELSLVRLENAGRRILRLFVLPSHRVPAERPA